MAQREHYSDPRRMSVTSGPVGLAIAVAWAIAWIIITIFRGIQAPQGFSLDAGMIVLALAPLAFVWLWVNFQNRIQKLERQNESLAQNNVKLASRIKSLETSRPPRPTETDLLSKINELANAQKKSDEMLAVFMSSRAIEDARQDATPLQLEQPLSPQQSQPSLLPMSASMLATHLSNEDFIRAANFPRSADDRAGFAVMKLASKDKAAGPFINSAQDVLTLLSHEGVYMDDMLPEPTRPEIWRSFANGARGRDVANLGAIRERKVLEKIATRMREDTVFRDAVHHFLRKFDFTFTDFAQRASNDEIALFSETRSARAFMLLGRIAGTFD